MYTNCLQEKEFEGFKKDDINKVVKSNFLTVEVSRSAKKVNVENTNEVTTWLRSSAKKVSIDSFRGIVQNKNLKKPETPKKPKSPLPPPPKPSVTEPKSTKKPIPKVEVKPPEKETPVNTSKIFPLCKSTSKSMKGSIKIRFSRPSFYKDLGARKFSKISNHGEDKEEEEEEENEESNVEDDLNDDLDNTESELQIDEGVKEVPKVVVSKKKSKRSSRKAKTGQ